MVVVVFMGSTPSHTRSQMEPHFLSGIIGMPYCLYTKYISTIQITLHFLAIDFMPMSGWKKLKAESST